MLRASETVDDVPKNDYEMIYESSISPGAIGKDGVRVVKMGSEGNSNIEGVPAECIADKYWGLGNNPKNTVCEYLKTHPELENGGAVYHQRLICAALDAYVKQAQSARVRLRFTSDVP